MVTVAIMGIVMAAGIVAFSNAQKTARDAKRRADLDAIGKALEQYYQDNNSYPTLNAVSTNGTVVSAIGQYFPSGRPPGGGTINGVTRNYQVRSESSRFCVHVSAGLETLSGRNCNGGSTVCSFSSSSPITYCVSSRQ